MWIVDTVVKATLTGRENSRLDFQIIPRSVYRRCCEFISCRFNGSYLEYVKFSNCSFRYCNFSHCTIANSQFISECTFTENSASAEEFVLKSTSIEASPFIEALVTNLRHIPADEPTTRAYQLSRHVETKLGIAQSIYGATREENDIDLFSEAYRELILRTLDWRIERRRYLPKGKYDKPELANRVAFHLRVLPIRLEKLIVWCSGELSDWGRSIAKPVGVFAILMAFFFNLYLFLTPGASFWDSSSAGERFLRALDVTLVAGYTAHCGSDDPISLRWCTAINMIAGLFWYSLIVPVLTRRLLR